MTAEEQEPKSLRVHQIKNDKELIIKVMKIDIYLIINVVMN